MKLQELSEALVSLIQGWAAWCVLRLRLATAQKVA